MFILSAPSGAGKTTLASRLLTSVHRLRMSVSVTTRPRRPGEQDGKDYRFVSDAEFDRMIDQDELLEWTSIYRQRYGTPRRDILHWMAEGIDCLFDVDWQGSERLAGALPDECVSVLLVPPSMSALRERLQKRQTDTMDQLQLRLRQAVAHLSHYKAYDYILVNDDLDEALNRLRSILYAERARRRRLTQLDSFFQELAGEMPGEMPD